MRTFNHPAIDSIRLEQVLYALSDPVRLTIVNQLASDGETTCSALDCGRPKSTMSHHFRVLRESGVVHTRCEGTTHHNSVRREDLEHRFPGLLDAVLAAREIS